MRRTLLALLLAAAALPAAAAPAERPVPVFGIDGSGPLLQARVFSDTYAVAPVPWAELAAWAAARPQDPMGLAARYLARVTGDAEPDLRNLYVPGTDPTAVAQTTSLLSAVFGALGRPATLRPLETWYFGEHASPAVEITTEDGKRRVLALPMTRTAEGWRRNDHWGAERPMQDLFGLMANNLQKGHAAPPQELPVALTVPGGEYPVTLEFAGRAWPPAASGEPVPAFVERALALADGGTDAEFLALWSGESAERMQRDFLDGSGLYASRRYEIGELDLAAHLLTVELGDALAHYFRTEEGAVEVLFLERTPGGPALSDDLTLNLRNLLSWDRVERQVPAISTETEP